MDGTIKVRGSLVLVKPLPPEEITTRGNIVIPPAVSEKGVTYAQIKDVGPGRLMENGERFDMADLRVGATVLLQASRMMPIQTRDQKCGVINESDILAVIERPEVETQA